MDLAPPMGLRIEERAGRLMVRLRPRRSWFLLAWLPLWTFLGSEVFGSLGEEPEGRAFMLVWLFGWTLGECLGVALAAWQLFGYVVLTITPQQLEVRQELGRFARMRRFNAALIHGVSAERVPSGEDERPRKDFCLELRHDDGTVRVGEGMSEREAEYVASRVLAWVRPRRPWGEEGPDAYAPARPTGTSERRSLLQTLLRSVAFPVLVVAALVFIYLDRDEPRPSSARPPSQPSTGFPMPSDFPDPRAFASAQTTYTLRSGGMSVVLTQPNCGEPATWAAWTCTARARAMVGPYAGRTLVFRCRYTRHPSGGGGTLCEPERPEVSERLRPTAPER